MINAVVIGPGFVGKATGYLFGIEKFIGKEHEVEDWYLDKFNYFFLCVPTPTKSDGTQNLEAIEEWLERISSLDDKDRVVIIRSTVLPGTIRKLQEKYSFTIAHIPEFLSESTAIEDELYPEFVVIGCNDIVVREKLRKIFIDNLSQENTKFILCDSTTAELIKYSMNSFFSLKVIFGNQIWDVAKEVGADYSKVKKALESHKWGSKNGWDVWHKGFRGFSGKCLPKDLYAFTKRFKLPLLDAMRKVNKKLVSETI